MEAPKKDYVERHCDNCKYEKLSAVNEPCKSCTTPEDVWGGFEAKER